MPDSISFWMDRIARPQRPSLPGDIDVDVCIIGGGYTGLWAAYYLAKTDPSLRIAVLERQFVGFGASGRNGGWASAKFAGLDRLLADASTRAGAIAMYREMIDTVHEIERVVGEEAIDCGLVRGGTVVSATRPAHVARLKASVDLKHAAGFSEADAMWMEPAAASQVVRTSRNFGAYSTPHCLALDPGRLVVGLARVVEQLGVTIYENTPASVGEGVATTPFGTVSAPSVVLATEAYRAGHGPRRRGVIPVYSLMVATAPIDAAAWEQIGLAGRETFSDGRHMIIYGQRTDDDRLAFGGRGAPYHFASRIEDSFDRNQHTFDFLRATIVDLFPVLRDVEIVASWGGPLAIPRDWRPSVQTGGAAITAGGYVGQGVATANLAGRTIRDLVLGHDTSILHLPWVGHRSRSWEPEPFRWIGVNLGRKLTESIDHAEELGRRPRARQAILDRLPVG